MFVRGTEIPPPVDPIFRMFVMCSHMKWAHLPMPGGLYDQSPEFLDKVYAIMTAQSAEEARRQKERENKTRSKGASRSRR